MGFYASQTQCYLGGAQSSLYKKDIVEEEKPSLFFNNDGKANEKSNIVIKKDIVIIDGIINSAFTSRKEFVINTNKLINIKMSPII